MVLEPILWNVLYDGVLKKLTEGAKALGFADDLAILVRARDGEELEHRSNESLRRINRWMDAHQLKPRPKKTEMVILRGS